MLRRTLRELNPHCLWLEALSRDAGFPSSGLDTPVATAAVRPDPLEPTNGYLTLLHFVNDRTTLHTLFENLAETLRPHGVRTLTGPTQLLPFLGGGALSSHWHQPPPLETPYQAPYATEHLSALMKPEDTSALFHLEASQGLKAADAVRVTRLEPERLTSDLLPLLKAVAAPYPLSDVEAQALLLRWLRPYGLRGFWGASPAKPDVPAGFVLVYGARHPLNPLRQNVQRSGRLWGGVHPDARGQGLGRALLQAGLSAALEYGWESVSLGPVPEQGEAARFLRDCGGVPQQRYTLYRTSL